MPPDIICAWVGEGGGWENKRHRPTRERWQRGERNYCWSVTSSSAINQLRSPVILQTKPINEALRRGKKEESKVVMLYLLPKDRGGVREGGREEE